MRYRDQIEFGSPQNIEKNPLINRVGTEVPSSSLDIYNDPSRVAQLFSRFGMSVPGVAFISAGAILAPSPTDAFAMPEGRVGASVAASTPSPYPDSSSKGVVKKIRRLYKECGDPMVVNEGSGAKRDRKDGGTLKVTYINGGNRQKFSWTYPRGDDEVCGISAQRQDHTTMFPEPTKTSRRGGNYVNPLSNKEMRIGLFVLWTR